MRTDQNCHAFVPEIQDYFFQLLDSCRIKSYHRLIEKDYPGLYSKGAANAHFLHHSFGQLIPQFLLFIFHLEFSEDFIYLFICNIAAVRHPDIFYMFPNCQSIKHIRYLGHIGKYFLCVHTSRRKSLDTDCPFVTQKSGDTLDDRRFTGAIWSEQDSYLSVRHGKTHIIHCHVISISFTQPLYF